MISVIVPYWNAAQWVGRCAESIKANAGDFEVIFVNDHSTDNGEQVAKQHADARFIFIDNK